MFRLSNYWALFLLLLIPYAYYLTRKSLADLSDRRKWSAFAIRSTLILLLILAIGGLQFVRRTDRLCTIFALDVSDSITESESKKALEFINSSVKDMKENDLAGLIVFGKEAYVDIPPKSEINIASISSTPDKKFTSIDSAIITSLNVFPSDMQKRVVLISDGNENVVKVGNESLAMLKANEVQIYSVPLKTRLSNKSEVFISNLLAQSQVNPGRTFEIKAVLVSNVNTRATLKLFRDREYVDEKQVAVSKDGKNVYAFPQSIDNMGTYIYEVNIEPENDTLSENNSAQCLVTVSGKPKILYLNGDKENRSYIPQILNNKGIEVSEIADPSSIPRSLAELQDYKAIIFDNVPSYLLTKDQMQMIERYVHEIGGGFVMIGGENSFGSGGYHDTPIEEILPVKMIPEKKKRSISMALLIDRSGSMNALSGKSSKIELAKEAAISVVEILTDKDQIGVIAFDAQADEVVRLQGIQGKKRIIEQIGKIRARGGTNMYPALKVASDWLTKADTQLKHAIIISDGQSLQMNESLDLVKQMASKSITFSTIAISDEADKKAMQEMSRLGSGRHYETTDASTLPRILIKEALMSSDLIVERAFQPISSGSNEILAGIDNVPILFGYVQTSPKDSAEMMLRSDQGDPILSVWQYGLGRTIAFTSDALPKWAVEWVKWDNFGKFWSQAVGWCLPIMSDELNISTDFAGSKGNIVVDAFNTSGQFRNFIELQARIIKPDLSVETMSLNQTGIGRYEANFDANQMGTYMLSVAEIIDGKPEKRQNTGMIVSYSPEYTNLDSNIKVIQELADATNGVYKPTASDIFGDRPERIWKIGNVWKWLLIIAIPLFFIDVAIRRLTISREQLAELWQALHIPSREKIIIQKPITLENLKIRKESISPIPKRQSRPKINPPTKTITSSGSYTSRLLEAKKRAESS